MIFKNNKKQKLSMLLIAFLLVSTIFTFPNQVVFASDGLPDARSIEVSGDLYLGGNYIELGIDNNGWFGASTDAPDVFHPYSRFNIGMVMDNDGFDFGNAPTNGDFVLPGGPVEGYGIGYKETSGGSSVVRVNTNPLLNSNFSQNMSLVNLSSDNTLSACHTVDDSKIKLEQIITFNEDDKFFKIDVKMTNITESTLYDVRYFRKLDPDQDLDISGTYSTKNKVVENPITSSGKALVYAKGPVTDTPFFYLSFDPSARASVTSSSDPYSSAMYNVDGDALLTSEINQDTHIAMTFAKGDIDSGESVTVTLYASLDSDVDTGLEIIEEVKMLEDPYLTGLTIENGTLNSAVTTSSAIYTAILPVGTTTTKVTPTATSGSAITVNNVSVESGSPSSDITVSPGHNTISVSVTKGSTVKDITIDAIVASNYLSSLTLDTGTLTPTFDSATENYTVTYSSATTSTSITVVSVTTDAAITINNDVVISGSPHSVPLNEGENTISVAVKAEDNSVRTYTIIGTRTQSSTNNSSHSSNKSNVPSTPGSAVIVNGESQNYGAETEKIIGGTKTVQVTFNSTKLNELIDTIIDKSEVNTNNVVKIPIVNNTADVIKAVLTGDIIKKMEDNMFDLNISTGTIDYIINAKEVGITNIAKSLGVSSDALQSIDIEVVIEKANPELVKAMESKAKQLNNYEILFPLIEFRVNAKTIDNTGVSKSVEVSRFSTYVERVMKIPVGVDPSKITTGVICNVDGTLSHVPTTVFEKDDVWYASLKSLTNSNYTVIWNDVEVASVNNHWSKDVVNDLASRLVIDDTESFDPTSDITRADFATYIVKALGLYRTNGEITNIFSDVSVASDKAYAISLATQYGLINGYEDGTFRPKNSITRLEAMAIMSRALKIAGVEVVGTNDLSKYIDYSTVPKWASNEVALAVTNRVFTGTTSTTLSPYATFTYAEAAQATINLLINTDLINK